MRRPSALDRRERGLVRLAIASAVLMGAITGLSLAGCASETTSKPAVVHSADVSPEDFRAVEAAIREGGWEITSRNLRMSYGDSTATVAVAGEFVAPTGEGGGEFGTLTLERTLVPTGTWIVVGRQ